MKHTRLALAALGLSLLAVLAFAGTALATTTLQFEERDRGSTFRFVDNAPKTTLNHGFPAKISPGDVAVGSTPLVEGKRKIGRLETSCVATRTARKFDAAGFMCQGTFVFSNGGTLVASAIITGRKQTEGAITGGTGLYADARGTFVTKEGGTRSKVTVTLVR